MAAKHRRAHAARGDTLPPTVERLAHGMVERLPRPIADERGAPARPFRAVDVLAGMERRGSITAGMRAAGEDFRRIFFAAHLDPLRAAPYERAGGSAPSATGPGFRIESARERVWLCLIALGGVASPAGACLWHVVGLEQPLKQWALECGWRDRRIDQETASGILIGALGMLEAYHQNQHRRA